MDLNDALLPASGEEAERPPLFSGWTQYGYWENGQLYSSKPRLNIWPDMRRLRAIDLERKLGYQVPML